MHMSRWPMKAKGMHYRPWLGITLLGLSIIADVLLGRSGFIFMTTFFGVLYWATR